MFIVIITIIIIITTTSTYLNLILILFGDGRLNQRSVFLAQHQHQWNSPRKYIRVHVHIPVEFQKTQQTICEKNEKAITHTQIFCINIYMYMYMYIYIYMYIYAHTISFILLHQLKVTIVKPSIWVWHGMTKGHAFPSTGCSFSIGMPDACRRIYFQTNRSTVLFNMCLQDAYI